jgi:hypothetical protein
MGTTARHEARAKNLFFEFVSRLLPSDKADRYKQNFQNDLPELLGNVKTEYKRVHTSEDRNVRAYFNDTDIEKEFESFRKEILKDNERMKSEGTDKVMTSINSYVVVFPPEMGGRFAWIDIEDVVDVVEDVYLMFKAGEQVFLVNDDGFSIYSNNNGKLTLEKEIFTELGYAPFAPFWKSKYKDDNRIIKASPLYTSFPKFDKFIHHQNGRFNYELWAKYAVLQIRKPKCTYEDTSEGKTGYCDGFGTISGTYWMDDVETSYHTSCPECQRWKLLGPGTVIETPEQVGDAPQRNDPAALLISADVPTLDYNAKTTFEYRNEIVNSLIGVLGSFIGREAVNEKQVAALLEEKNSILESLAQNFEVIHEFILKTAALYQYPEQFEGAVVDYGKRFFLKSSDELLAEYDEAKKAAAPQFVLDSKLERAIKAKTQNNPPAQERSIIMMNLEPFIHSSIKEVQEYAMQGLASTEQAQLKINFTALMARFERENGSVNQFEQFRTLDQRIDSINAQLITYLEGTADSGEVATTNNEETETETKEENE